MLRRYVRLAVRGLLLVLIGTTFTAVAVAGEDSRAGLNAEGHFEAGMAAFKAQDLQTACSHFEQSYGMDPLPGVLFTLATCEARLGRTSSATKRYREFLDMVAALPRTKKAEQKARIAAAEAELSALNGRVPKISIHIDADARGRVRLNDVEVGAAELERPIAIDPGDHTITLEDESGIIEQRKMRISAGEEVRVELGKNLQKTVKSVAPAPTPKRLSNPKKSKMTGLDLAFYSAVATGGIGLGVGGVTGIIALSAKGCDRGRCPTKSDLTSAERARTIADVSTIAFIVGGAGAAAAVVVKVIASREHSTEEKPQLALNLAVAPGNLALTGTF